MALDTRVLETVSRDLYLLAAKARAAGASDSTVKAIMAASAKALKDSAKKAKR